MKHAVFSRFTLLIDNKSLNLSGIASFGSGSYVDKTAITNNQSAATE